jgi:hypothetical protein
MLGSRSPYTVDYVQMESRIPGWCDMRQHYSNDPLFEVRNLRQRLVRYVCIDCMLSYPKDSKYYSDDVPKKPFMPTTGGLTITRKLI